MGLAFISSLTIAFPSALNYVENVLALQGAKCALSLDVMMLILNVLSIRIVILSRS